MDFIYVWLLRPTFCILVIPINVNIGVGPATENAATIPLPMRGCLF